MHEIHGKKFTTENQVWKTTLWAETVNTAYIQQKVEDIAVGVLNNVLDCWEQYIIKTDFIINTMNGKDSKPLGKPT